MINRRDYERYKRPVSGLIYIKDVPEEMTAQFLDVSERGFSCKMPIMNPYEADMENCQYLTASFWDDSYLVIKAQVVGSQRDDGNIIYHCRVLSNFDNMQKYIQILAALDMKTHMEKEQNDGIA